MKKRVLLIIGMLIMVTLVGCNADSDVVTSKTIFEELCSDKYAGRLVGTQGNRDAEDYLASCMKKIGLVPYNNDSYKMPYNQLVADPNEQNPKVTITYADGTTSELVHGKDFYTNAATKSVNAIIPLTHEATNTADNAHITAWEQLSLGVSTPDGTQNFGINITQKLKNELMNKGAVNAHVTADFAGITKEMNNVVGVIKGNGSTNNAVVIMAHFDHVGKQGDFLFSGILDNASGTATAMVTASKLLALTADKKLDYDVIIAAVNSEETNSAPGEYAGSGALVNILKNDYDSITSINIDCVGNGEPLYMANVVGQDRAIADKLIPFFEKNGVLFVNEHYCEADATSFRNANYPAITIGTLLTGEFSMHSADMKTTDISIDELENISKSVAELVVEGGLFTADIHTSNQEEGSDEWFKQLRDVAAEQQGGTQLKANQYMYVNFDNKLIQISGDFSFTDLAELKEYYPSIEIPQTLSEYSFSKVIFLTSDTGGYSIVANNSPPNGLEKNKAYDIKLESENIYQLLLEYTKEDGGFKIYVSKHNGELLQGDEYTDITPIEIAGYGSFKLISQKATDDFYSIAKETGTWTIRFNHYLKDMSSVGFSKDEMIAFAQTIFPEEKL